MKKFKRILLIDDDTTTNYYHQIIFEEANISEEIKVFENAQNAVAYIEKNEEQVDLIFLDINMPIMNGWQFLEQLELINTSAIQDIKVVILTSSMSENDKKKSEAYKSVKKYVTKPLLANAIESLMDSL